MVADRRARLPACRRTAIVTATAFVKIWIFSMQVIGLCRFSYPALGGFQVVHETIEERIAYLYSDARISRIYAGTSEIMREIIGRGLGLDERQRN